MPVLLHGDCLEVMKTLPDKSVDCFICDLPYGQLTGGFARPGHNEEVAKKVAKQSQSCCAWDVKIDLAAFWEQVKRLAKDDHTPVLMFCNTRFGIDLINSNPTWFRYDLVWNKQRGISFLLANKQPMKSHEMIYVFSKKGSYYKRVDEDSGFADSGKACAGVAGKRCSLSVIDLKKPAPWQLKDSHPTEKPVELYRWLLERYCPAGGTVLDPTAGSFNAVAAAESLGLKGIGIEKDVGFFKKAQERFVIPPVEDMSGDIITLI
jgi:DNA modification methylase